MTLKAISEKSGLSTKDVDKVFDAMVEIIDNGGQISIRGFGIFKPKYVKKRLIWNPITKTEVWCKEYHTITFKGSGKLRDRLAKVVDSE